MVAALACLALPNIALAQSSGSMSGNGNYGPAPWAPSALCGGRECNAPPPPVATPAPPLPAPARAVRRAR